MQIAVDAIGAARHSHHFLSVTKDGNSAIFQTSGNQDCHLILRGGKAHTNYDAASVDDASAMLARAGLPERVMIDCSHANARKLHRRQRYVARDVCAQLGDGDQRIMGVMLESNLVEGAQDVANKPLTRGQSVTDACLGWEDTLPLLEQLAAAVRKRREDERKSDGGGGVASSAAARFKSRAATPIPPVQRPLRRALTGECVWRVPPTPCFRCRCCATGTFQLQQVRRLTWFMLFFVVQSTLLLGVFYHQLLGDLVSGTAPLLFAAEELQAMDQQVPGTGVVMVRWLVLMLAVNALSMLCIGIYLIRKLGNPLLAIRRALDEIAAGNLNVRLRAVMPPNSANFTSP